MADDEPSYIDYETFLDPDFSPAGFANTLVLATNNPSDTPLDLATPLSRVLFDVQEIDTHIDTLTTKSALPLLSYTKEHAASSTRILDEVEGQVATLTESYRTLEREVSERFEVAEQVRIAAERLCQTVQLGRAVARCLTLGRQLELQMAELGSSGSVKREDHRAMVRSANTVVLLRHLFMASGPGEEGEGLSRIHVVATLRSELAQPSERAITTKCQQIVREFSMSTLLNASSNATTTAGSAATFQQTEDIRSRATSAILTLYLLSPVSKTASLAAFEPSLLVSALQDYLQTAVRSSLASLSRALATLPTLDRTLIEVSARCQNIVALENLLEAIKPPTHPVLSEADPSSDGNEKAGARNLLGPMLQSLDTSSLPSFFWRSLASGLSSRVQEILNRGGVSARTLRSNRDKVRESLRDCVNWGSQLPGSSAGRSKSSTSGNWEREAAVMVGAVVGILGR